MRAASFSALIALGGLVPGSVLAAQAPPPAVPAPLRPWVAWVLDSEEGGTAKCPAHTGDSSPVCAWPARLGLNLSDRGGAFRQEWTIFKPGWATLPGGKEHWPVAVNVDGKRRPIIEHDGEAQVGLTAGRHVVTGGFVWDALPESLLAPTETGLIALRVRGRSVAFPMRERDGRVFLGHKDESGDDKAQVEEETLDIQVYRKLTDTTPLALTTQVVLAVSGKNREILLGKALPAGFSPVAVDSPLPLRFEGDGRLRVQARRGVWNIQLQAHRVSAEKSVTRPVPGGPWKEGDEAWVFEAKPELRTVAVEGVPAIDPALTLMPSDWKTYPAYAVAPLASLTLSEQQRGDAKPAPDSLRLDRTLWLDSDGSGLSVHDAVAGEFTRMGRLEMGQGTRLGRLAIDGQDQFITHAGTTGRDGVEIRGGRATIEADSRIDGGSRVLPATSFAHDFDQVSTTVNVPVGWDLFHASGADNVSGSWIERWSLGQVVLLLVLVLLIARLYGWRLGALSVVALGLSLGDARAPAVAWLVVLGGELLVRSMGQGPALAGARAIRLVLWGILAVVAIPFAIEEAQFAIHPASALDHNPPSRFVQFALSMGQSGDNRNVPADRVAGEQGRFANYALSADSEDAPEYLNKASSAGILGIVGAGKSGTMGRRHQGEEGKAGLFPLKNTLGTSIVKPKIAEFDPSTVVQSGEGLPRWTGRSANLAYHGAVTSDRMIRLYFIPPWLGRGLALAKVGLLLLLAWLLVRRPVRLRGVFVAPRPLITGLATLLLLLPTTSSAADFPSPEILTSLKDRLLSAPDCAPDCTAINDMVLEVSPPKLRITLHVSAAASAAIALPGDTSSWSPNEVLVDGKTSSELHRDSNGVLWVVVSPGIHTIALAGPLPSRDNVQLPLPMRPHRATARADGFVVGGIHDDGAVDESVVLTREATPKNGAHNDTDAAPVLPPFLRVERTLVLGLKWEVHTKVTRETPAGSPIVIDIPLLPGESATTAGIRSEKARDTVSLSFSPNEREVAWDSTLAQAETIVLRADPAAALRWSEIWRVEVGPSWHATFAGIPPVRGQPGDSVRIPEWRPWPGEEVRIAVEKPSGVAGRTLTIDASTLGLEPGLRTLVATLQLEIRSSRGTEHRISLPPASEAVVITRDRLSQPLRQEGQDLVLTVPPGPHTFEIRWRQSVGLSTFFRAPAVDLHVPSANSRVTIGLSEAPRWLLWVGGPATGPLVGFWMVAGLLLLASLALARTKVTPLATHHWFLLGLGLIQTDVTQAMVVPACLLALGWRARRPQEARPLVYDLGQAALLVLASATIVTLVGAIDTGLWRHPGMFVLGNQSTGSHLFWYQDRAVEKLAEPWMVSLPLWVYRGALLAWAVWLALAGMKWASWAWSCFSTHGLWRPIAKPFVSPPKP